MKSNRAKRWGFILIFAGFAIGIPGILMMLLPARYEAVARVNVSHQAMDAISVTNGVHDPYFIQTEFEVIRSEAVLKPVVAGLHLDADWSKRYAIGRPLTEHEAIDLLRQTLHVQSVRDTKFIDVGAISEIPEEAAKIANAVAESFRDRYLNTTTSATKINVEIINAARPNNVPIGHHREVGRILLISGVVLILAGIRLLWKSYFAAPRGI